MLIIIIILIVVLKFLPNGIKDYNDLVRLRNHCKTSWAQIDVFLKQRADLVPNLVEVVKGYATHERESLESVIKARSCYEDSNTPQEQLESSKSLNNELGKIMMLSESYPDLKANTNFLDLQRELLNIENSISSLRQDYNNSVNEYQNKKEVFPSNIVAYLFEFKDFG